MMNLSMYSTDTTYVALAATILPPDLQAYASAAGLCHLRITSSDTEQCLLEVAALPHRLNDSTHSKRVFTLWVDIEHLAHSSILPWDRTLQSLPTCDVRECLQAQLFAVPLSTSDDGTLPVCAASLEGEPEGAEPAPQEQECQVMTLLPLPEVFISCQTVNEAVAEAPEPPFAGSAVRLTRWTRLVWLHAALAMVRRQLTHSRQVFHKLDILLDKVIGAQRRLRQALVSASAVYVGDRLVGGGAGMKQSTPKPRRLRGFRIHIFRGARHQPPSVTTPTLWREQPPVVEWERIINDPATRAAYMIRSGRKMKHFQFSRSK